MASTLQIPNGFGNASFRWTFIPAGQQVIATMGYWDQTSANDPNAAALQMRNALAGAGSVAEAAAMTTQWRFDGVTVLQRLTTGLLQVGINNTAVTGTGTASADLSPVFTTWVVSKGTPYAGRAYRGRMYPPITSLNETAVDFNGTINPANVVTQQARWSVFLSAINATGYSLRLLHAVDQYGVTPLPTGISTLTVRPVVGLQRRRRA